ncbi:sensor histidine kinase [Flavobacterium seoulense]|uniref:histidine kinase n=1 Tax=Flavobacterium seoulense TaxID=1492738 RepID=A0A066WRH9_9FLAO|nr:HAMP domain-containing sensor histidine kinase [Flavobacterium seoulense]KDN55183.1 histidine kinase [Flavobacterium seoulense]
MFQFLLIDPKTVFQLYFLGNLFVCILIFSYSFSYATSDSKKILNWFGYGKLLLTIGWIFLFLRNIIPDFISINIANSIVFSSCCYETMAVLSMLKTKSKQSIKIQIGITITAIIAFNIATFLESTINTRVLIAAIGLFAIYLRPTIKYFTERGHNFFRFFYGFCFAAFEILLVLRVVFNYFNPQKSFFAHGIFDGFYNISLFLLSLTSTVGFLLLIKEKQDLKIKKLLKDRNQFFSIIAHDLRGPLGGSVGLSEILAENFDEYSNEEIKEISQMLHQSSKNSYKLLENLLDWSQVQTGMIEFSPRKIGLNALIKENVEFNKNAALNKNITLLFESAEFIEVQADKNMIDTIVRNLLTNAIKFTKKDGEVTVRMEKQTQRAVVSITDTGVGISDEIKAKLFKINGKVTQRGTEDEIGTGLGLLLCSEFVKKHDGEIWAESELGKGSTFKFTLPL